jgi:uncharacterized protein (TIGR03437 family)
MKTVKVLKSTFRQMMLAVGCLVGLSLAAGLQPGRATQFAAFAQGGGDVAVVNAASFNANRLLTANGIASAFGVFKTQSGQGTPAPSTPLPTTLDGVTVRVNGTAAPLVYVSPTQINFIVPGSTAAGTATVVVTNSDNSTTSGTFTVTATEPGVFRANPTVGSTAAAQTTVDGVAIFGTANPDATPRDIVLESGPGARPTYLILYATGLRNAPAATPNDENGVAEAVRVTVQGVPATVAYAGPQGAGAPGSFIGLDQINLIIPPELRGLGTVEIEISVLNQGGTVITRSNVTTIKLAGTLPALRLTDIAAGQTVTGALSIDDQVEMDALRDTYFIDAFRYRATAGTSIEIDLRSTQFDPVIILRRIGTNDLTFFAADDQGGGFGQGNLEVNNNSLLLTVFPDNAEYAVFVTSYEPNEVGAYTLKVTSGNVTPVAYGATVNGAIAATDLRTEAGVYLDAYALNITQGDRVQITMRSSTLDSFLQLRKMHGANSGDEVAFDDNSGGNFDAQITTNPASANITTGLYVIVATPLEVNRTGNYTLTVTKLSAFTGEQETLELQPVRIPARQVAGGAEADSKRRSSSIRFAVRRPVERNE